MASKFKAGQAVVRVKDGQRGEVMSVSKNQIGVLWPDGGSTQVNARGLQDAEAYDNVQKRKAEAAEKKAAKLAAQKEKAAAAKAASAAEREAKSAERKAARERRQQELAEKGAITSGKLTYNPARYIEQDVKTASGNKVRDTDDEAARLLRGKAGDELFEAAAEALNTTVEALRERYGSLNPGMQRMTLANRIRGHAAAQKKAAEKAANAEKRAAEKAERDAAKAAKAAEAAAAKEAAAAAKAVEAPATEASEAAPADKPKRQRKQKTEAQPTA